MRLLNEELIVDTAGTVTSGASTRDAVRWGWGFRHSSWPRDITRTGKGRTEMTPCSHSKESYDVHVRTESRSRIFHPSLVNLESYLQLVST
jgi:hypothetical protein